MMRRLVQRHHGILPLDTVESIWRVIIATFTYVQAPFSVHADLSTGESRDARFARDSISASPCPRPAYRRAERGRGGRASRRATSALVPAVAIAGAGPWWMALEAASAPKIIARLPFVERADHPAGLPVFVVPASPPTPW